MAWGFTEKKKESTEVLISKKESTEPIKELEVPIPLQNMESSRVSKVISLEEQNTAKLAEESKLASISTAVHNKLIPVLELPSLFKAYPQSVKVYYKRYTFGEIEYISNLDLRLIDKYKLMLKGIVVEGMPVTSLTFYDFDYISTLRRLEAQSAVSFNIPFKCIKCGQDNIYSFTLDKIGYNTLDANLPLRVRFYSYPDTVLEFMPHTVGDILTLLDNDTFFKRIGSAYLLDIDDDKVVNIESILACSVISHTWEQAYNILNSLTDERDHKVLHSLDKLLNHRIQPFEVRCNQPNLVLGTREDITDSEAALKQQQLNDEIDKVHAEITGNAIKLPWVEELKKINNVCNHTNYIDIQDGNVLIIPFRGEDNSSEFGILS